LHFVFPILEAFPSFLSFPSFPSSLTLNSHG
jgi:hypothetical protein